MLPSTTITNSTVVWNSILLKALCCQRQYYVVPTVNNAPGSLDGRPDSSTANPMIISTATNSAVAIVNEGNASAKSSNRYLHTVKGGSTVSIQHFITKTITSAAKLSAVFSNKPNDLDSNFKSSTTSSLDSFNSTPDGLYSKPDDFNSVHTTFTLIAKPNLSQPQSKHGQKKALLYRSNSILLTTEISSQSQSWQLQTRCKTNFIAVSLAAREKQVLLRGKIHLYLKFNSKTKAKEAVALHQSQQQQYLYGKRFISASVAATATQLLDR